MTDRSRPVNEFELDALIGSWLRDGANTAPDRIAENAMLEIATTPQERARLAAIWPSTSSPLGWTILAAVAVLAVGLGLLISLRLIGNPTPRPTPTPDPSALVLFSSEDAGYQMLIPASWGEVDSGSPDARKWVGPDGELIISYGTSIFEGGEVTVCAPPLPSYNTCATLTHGYSIPFNPDVDGVGPNSMEVWLDRCDGTCPVTKTVTGLDLERASHERAVIAGRQLTYVSTFHNRRPVIVYWSELIAVADASRVERMRSSFRFLDPQPSGTQEPFLDPTELVTYTNAEDGYQLSIPRFWDEGAERILDGSGQPIPGVRTFGSGGGFGSRGDPAMTISIGNADGSVYLCGAGCQTVTASTLDELGDLLISVPAEFAGAEAVPAEVQGDLLLGGEAARFERPGYTLAGSPHADLGIGAITEGNCLGCPGMLYQVYTLHGGRPVVIAVDYWTIAFERMTPDYVVQILDSFGFLD